MPSETIKVVSRYAARKLTYGYLNDSYVKLLYDQQKSYLKKWCAGKTIHPPEQYIIPYIHSDSAGNNNAEIKLGEEISGQNIYKDYNLKVLGILDKYLKENNAKLYLSSPFFESKRNLLGVLSCLDAKQNEQLQPLVKKKGRKAVRYV